MIDALFRLLAHLEADAPLVAFFGANIFAALDTPPEGYQPTDGPCLVFKKRGGGQDESGRVQTVSFQFKSYQGLTAGGQINASANSGASTLWDALNYNPSYYVLGAQQEGQGADLIEPDTGWLYVLSFYRAQMRNV